MINDAVEAAVDDCGADLTTVGDQVGMIAISESCTVTTMQIIAKATPRGRLSPLKFAGANPGSIAGLSCIQQGYRGPTLALSTAPTNAVGTASDIAASWLGRGLARYVLIATHRQDNDVHAARCLVLQAAQATDAARCELELHRLAARADKPAVNH
ncbi:hypothetical protein [Streptomyces sp. NPDC059639]|uniref:hypothetical protein n=1 Tax=Streptomyces sp. NPDC059639 TaxID=3346891 RepID=UPI0036A60031